MKQKLNHKLQCQILPKHSANQPNSLLPHRIKENSTILFDLITSYPRFSHCPGEVNLKLSTDQSLGNFVVASLPFVSETLLQGSISLSFCLSVSCLSVCLSVYLSLSVSLSVTCLSLVCLSLCLSLSHAAATQ